MDCLPEGEGVTFLKKLGASFSPDPPWVGVGHCFLSPLRNVGVGALNYGASRP